MALKENEMKNKKREKPRLLGALEGKIMISEDFKDELEYVSENEMKVLEDMRTKKNSETTMQEKAV